MDQSFSVFSGGTTPKIPDHELLRPIGRGTFGEVWLARGITGSFHAVKVVHRRNFDSDEPFDREFKGIKNFEPICRTHQGFLDILQVGRNDADGYFYTVMEIADSCDGNREITPETYQPKTMTATIATGKPLSYDECLEFGLHISSALAHLHKLGLVHRDIKPSNIIIVDGVPKLADIGMVTDAESASIAGGTVGYLPPEGKPSPQADIYSLGKVLYEISTGQDRLQHPELPEFWADAPNLDKLVELNEVVLKACDPDLRKRYATAEHLHQELALLQAGESVKRLRLLERILTAAKRIAGLALIIAGLAGYEYYRVIQQREEKSMRLADAHAAAGARLAAAGNFLAALPWYAKAFELDRNRKERAGRHWMNIDVATRYTPRKVRMFFESPEVNDVRISPSGGQVAEALEDGRVVVRNIDREEETYTLWGHTSGVRTVSWSQDGLFIVSASADSTARVWSTQTRTILTVLTNEGELFCADFNSSGTQIVTAGKMDVGNRTCGFVRIWRREDSQLLVERTNYTNTVRTAAFSPDNRLVVAGGEDSTAHICDSATLQTTTPLWHPPRAGSPSWVYSARFSPDGRFLATGSYDHRVRIWDLQSNQAGRFFLHDEAVRSVEFSPDGRYALTGSIDYTARIWDLERQMEAFPPLLHNSFVVKATFSPDGRLVATATTGGIVTIWDLAPAQWTPAPPTVYSLDGSRYAQFRSNSVQVFDGKTDLPLTNAFTTKGRIRDVKLTPAGNRLLLIMENNSTSNSSTLTAQLSEIDGKSAGVCFALPKFLPEHPEHFVAAISSNGFRVAFVAEGQVELWDARKGGLVFKHQHNGKAGAAVSQDGKRMVTYSSTNAFLIDALTGARISQLRHTNDVDYAEFSPDNRQLVTACRDDDERPLAAYVWNAGNGARLSPALQHGDGVSTARFSPDSRFLLTAGEDRVVKQWRVDNWTVVRQFQYPHPFVSASFNSTSTRVVTAASDDTACVWDATSSGLTGLPLTPPLKHLFNLWDVRFIGDGNRVLAKRLGSDRWTRGFDDQVHDSRWIEVEGLPSPQAWERTTWVLNGDPADPNRLKDVTTLLSGQRFDLNEPSVVSKDDLQSLWRKLHGSGTPGFDFFPNEIVAWHQRQAEEAEHHQDAFAAYFHVSRLAGLFPNDERLLDRRDRLRALVQLGAGTSQSSPGPDPH